MSEFVSKYEIQKRFHEWLEGFPENQRFSEPLDWDTSFCTSSGKRGSQSVHEDQTDLSLIKEIDKDRERAQYEAEIRDKDCRQGNFRLWSCDPR